ncbi:MAG TPA: maleylpyruvate isomerase N-terminal domain-containing protein [Streptosporangiaceae bacterium]|nr:maleylpyruvate isomerase N-terminal domain-containing protein [Streptosporangiaceae bacterium]
MDSADHLKYLAADLARFQEVAARDLAAPVPTCPGWTVTDLVLHVANAYVNVVVPQLRLPEQVPAQDLTGPDPLTALQHAYGILTKEFAAHEGRDHSGQDEAGTASFWARRMAQETVIHRIDAELAVAEPSALIPAAFAVDCIDEYLTVVLVHETQDWTQQYASDLSDWGQRWLLVSAGAARWRIGLRPQGADAAPLHSPPEPSEVPAAGVSGDADPLLRWMYNRGGMGQVTTTGDDSMTAQFRRLLTAVMGTS